MSPNGSAALIKVAVASCCYDEDVVDPEHLLMRYHAMSGWAEALARAGAAAVTVVQRFGREAGFRRRGVEYRFVADGGPGNIPAWLPALRLARAVRAVRPDVVHVDGLVYPAFVGCLRLGLPRDAAILVQDHGGHAGMNQQARAFRRLDRRLLYGLGLGAADAFIFTSRAQADPWRSEGIIRARQMVYEVPESSTDLAASLVDGGDGGSADSLPGKPALLWVARLDANKDPLTVLEGFAQAAPALPEAALTMLYGEDAMLPAVQTWIAAHPQLRGRIHLRGPVARNRLSTFYRSADLFVIGSHREVACFSLIEALSFGVTPVVTDIAPFRALTAGGSIGALFTPGDSAGLARAIRALGVVDGAESRLAVRAHFDRNLSWSVVGTRALAAYRSAAGARRRLG